VLPDFLLDEVGRFGVQTSEGFDKEFASGWGEEYLSLWSSGRGGLETVLMEGAESTYSSSV
jgi:hypothetical protein